MSLKRKADASWDRDNSDESDGEKPKLNLNPLSSNNAQAQEVDLSKRRIVKLKLPTAVYNESVKVAQNKPSGSFQLTSSLSTTLASSNGTENKTPGSVSFLSSGNNNQTVANKPATTESATPKPNLTVITEPTQPEPTQNRFSLFSNTTSNPESSNTSKPGENSSSLNSTKTSSGLFSNPNLNKSDSTQKFGLFGRTTSGEKSPLASTPLVSGKTQTPDKPFEGTQSTDKQGLTNPKPETKQTAFSFMNTNFSNKSASTVTVPNLDEPKLVRQDSSQLESKPAPTENKPVAKEPEQETPKPNLSETAKNINLFSNAAGQSTGSKLGLFSTANNGSTPFANLAKPEGEAKQEAPVQRALFASLNEKAEEKTPEPVVEKKGLFALGGEVKTGIFANLMTKPEEKTEEPAKEPVKEAPKSGGLFSGASTNSFLSGLAKKTEQTEEKKPEPVKEAPKGLFALGAKAETKSEIKSETAEPKASIFGSLPKTGLFGNKIETETKVEPLVKSSEPENPKVEPLVKSSEPEKPKVSLFGNILDKKEEAKPAQAQSGGLNFTKLFGNSGDMSAIANKDYSKTKNDTSGEEAQNKLIEAEKEKKQKAKEEAQASKPNPWSALNQPKADSQDAPKAGGLFASLSSQNKGLFAGLNDPNKPNLFGKSGNNSSSFLQAASNSSSNFLQKKDEAAEDEEGEDSDAEKEVLPSGGAPTLNKEAFKYEETTEKIVFANVAKFKAPETALFTNGEISLIKPKGGSAYFFVYRDVSKLLRFQGQVIKNISKVEFFNPKQDAITIVVLKSSAENKLQKEHVKIMFAEADQCKKFKESFEKNLL